MQLEKQILTWSKMWILKQKQSYILYIFYIKLYSYINIYMYLDIIYLYCNDIYIKLKNQNPTRDFVQVAANQEPIWHSSTNGIAACLWKGAGPALLTTDCTDSAESQGVLCQYWPLWRHSHRLAIPDSWSAAPLRNMSLHFWPNVTVMKVSSTPIFRSMTLCKGERRVSMQFCVCTIDCKKRFAPVAHETNQI